MGRECRVKIRANVAAKASLAGLKEHEGGDGQIT